MVGPEDLDNASKNASVLTIAIDGLTRSVEYLAGRLPSIGTAAQDAFGKVKEGAKAASQSISNLIANADAFGELSSGLAELKDEFTALETKAIDIGKFFMKSDIFEGFSNTAVNQFETIGESSKQVTSVLEQVLPASAKKSRAAIEMLDRVMQNASGGQKMEAAFYNMLTASGNFDKALDANGMTMKNLDSKTAEYVNSLDDMASGTNFTNKQVIEFATQLGKIPTLFNSTIDGATKTEGQISTVAGALRLASGTAQNFDDVIKEFTEAQTNLGNATGKVGDASKKGAEFISTMAEVSKDANLQFQDARSLLEQVAKQFEFISDNTEGAAKVISGFSKALQETGLTAKASADIVAKMVEQVTQLNLGTKAFISMRSGGPNGLQGAFKFEELLRQGKLNEVMGQMQRAFKQQAGGRIYSLEEASRSPEAAAQFARQRLLLQSGVFGIGKGTSDEQATRILEALKSGNVNLLQGTIKTGQDALKDIQNRGLEIQRQNNNELNEQSRQLERIAIYGQLSAAALVKENLGAGRKPEDVEKFVAQMANMIQKFDKEDREKFDLKGDHDIKEAITDIKPDTAQINKTFANVVRGLLGGGGEVLNDLLGGRKQKEAIASQQPIHASHDERIRQIHAAITDNSKQQKNILPQNVHLDINVTAPPGFGVAASTADNNVKVNPIQRHNVHLAGGGNPGDTGY